MAKAKIIRSWIELSETFLTPPKQREGAFEATLFTNRCELREKPDGSLLLRSTGITALTARSQDELDRKIRDFAMREDVRLLAKGVESNDFDTLPKEQKNPPQDIIDGTSDVYMVEDDAEINP